MNHDAAHKYVPIVGIVSHKCCMFIFVRIMDQYSFARCLVTWFRSVASSSASSAGRDFVSTEDTDLVYVDIASLRFT